MDLQQLLPMKETIKNEEKGVLGDLEKKENSTEEEKTPETTETVESSLNVKCDDWQCEELSSYQAIKEMVFSLIGKFFPKQDLEDFTSSELQRIYSLPRKSAIKIAKKGVQSAIEFYKKSDSEWEKRLSKIFNNFYPKKPKEYWAFEGIAQRRYEKQPRQFNKNFTFYVDQYDLISAPGELLCSKIAPKLFLIGDKKITPTANVERFRNGEKDAVLQSNLFEVDVFGSPAYRIYSRWEPYDASRLPRKTIAATIICTRCSENILNELVEDLRTTFAWQDEGAMACYLGYLLQPLLIHLCCGTAPAFFFLGPTGGGKGFLSNVFPGIVYCRPGGPTVVTKQITPNSYELEVLLNNSKNALFICFDEIKKATDESIKSIDALCTQQSVQVRKFRHGYFEIENSFVISMTAVYRDFTPETAGRLAYVRLKESRPNQIAQFYERWKKRGQEILRALYDKLNMIDIDINLCPPVPDRRPGFALISFAVEKVFGIKPSFKIETINNDVLDDLCEMFDDASEPAKVVGKNTIWKKYSIRTIANYLTRSGERRLNRSDIVTKINTVLPFSSTRTHPVFKDSGYQAESGKFYHIEIREEGERTVERLYISKKLKIVRLI